MSIIFIRVWRGFPVSISNKIDIFDNAIIGAGCAGLTLANRISSSTGQSIAIIDGQTKRPNHFWGFWDSGQASLKMARSITKKHWSQWKIISHDSEVVHTGHHTIYRAISSCEFEKIAWQNLKKNRNVYYFKSHAKQINQLNEHNSLELSNNQRVNAKTVFDSRPTASSQGVLLQHFLGLTIQCDDMPFDSSIATLMDFRVSQNEGIHFIYLLPLCEQTALVESTVFSQNPKDDIWYINQIKEYLMVFHKCQNFTIKDTERGIIPMSFSQPSSSMGTPIGLRSGALRSSSGYAFAQIQSQIWELSSSVSEGKKSQARPGCDYFEQMMDRVMLKILKRQPKNAPEIFIKIFKSVNGDQFADFMNGYSRWSSRLPLILNLPKLQFLKGLLN